ncbi:MAG: PTS sugar transporter subunit IIA [Deltaproteobacteria bacterium]|nr:PTS sugar transporter subunit IIA [Deltaproteobacteria bacterium]
MRVAEFLSESNVIVDLAATDKDGVLTEIAAAIANGAGTDASDLARALWAREKTGSTAIGEGVAIPHGRVASVPGIIGCFARSRSGIPFDARDGKPSQLFFALVAPESSAAQYLKALACVAGVFKKGVVRDRLLLATSRSEIYSLLTTEESANG